MEIIALKIVQFLLPLINQMTILNKKLSGFVYDATGNKGKTSTVTGTIINAVIVIGLSLVISSSFIKFLLWLWAIMILLASIEETTGYFSKMVSSNKATPQPNTTKDDVE